MIFVDPFQNDSNDWEWKLALWHLYIEIVFYLKVENIGICIVNIILFLNKISIISWMHKTYVCYREVIILVVSFDICAVYIMNKYIMKLQDFDLSYHPRAKIIVNIFWHVSKWMSTILKLLLYFIQPLHRPLCFLHLQEAQKSLLQRCLLMSFFVNL